jgi:hypothetical protein
LKFVIQNKLPNSFDLNQSDDESDYDKETQVEKRHRTIEMKKCDRKESMDSLYYAPTQVDRTNKHSIVKRTSSDDGPCTVEHTKVETVKGIKKFSSLDEARKYLEKVKSSTDDLFVNDETQEYDWSEEKTKTPKRKTLHSQNVKDVENTAKAHEDVYDIMTQVKIDEKKQDLENEKTNDIKIFSSQSFCAFFQPGFLYHNQIHHLIGSNQNYLVICFELHSNQTESLHHNKHCFFQFLYRNYYRYSSNSVERHQAELGHSNDNLHLLYQRYSCRQFAFQHRTVHRQNH